MGRADKILEGVHEVYKVDVSAYQNSHDGRLPRGYARWTFRVGGAADHGGGCVSLTGLYSQVVQQIRSQYPDSNIEVVSF